MRNKLQLRLILYCSEQETPMASVRGTLLSEKVEVMYTLDARVPDAASICKRCVRYVKLHACQ